MCSAFCVCAVLPSRLPYPPTYPPLFLSHRSIPTVPSTKDRLLLQVTRRATLQVKDSLVIGIFCDQGIADRPTGPKQSHPQTSLPRPSAPSSPNSLWCRARRLHALPSTQTLQLRRRYVLAVAPLYSTTAAAAAFSLPRRIGTSTSGRRNPRCSSPRPHSAHRHPTRPRLWRPAVHRLRKPSLAGPNLLCRTRAKLSSPNGTWLAGGSNSRGATRSRRTRQVRAHLLSPKDTLELWTAPRSTSVTVHTHGLHPNANLHTATAPGIFGIPLHTSIRYANVAISLFNDEGQSYIYGYVPIVVAKCGVFLKEKGT